MLNPVPPDRLGVVWDWVRDGLEQTIQKVQTRLLPEDAYMAIKSGQAFLYMIEPEGKRLGFVVFDIERETDGSVLHVAWLWGSGLIPHTDALVAEMDNLARANRCVRIAGDSPRSGFALHGHFKEVTRKYERELGHAS